MDNKIDKNAKGRESLRKHLQVGAEVEFNTLSSEDIRDFINNFNEVDNGCLLAIGGSEDSDDCFTSLAMKGKHKSLVITLAYAMARDSRLSDIVIRALGLVIQIEEDMPEEFKAEK